MKRLPLIILFIFLINSAHAGTVYCEGKILYVSMHNGGVVGLKMQTTDTTDTDPYIYLCNITENSNTVNGEACKAWYSSLLTAATANSTVEIRFEYDTSITRCEQFGLNSTYPTYPTILNYKSY